MKIDTYLNYNDSKKIDLTIMNYYHLHNKFQDKQNILNSYSKILLPQIDQQILLPNLIWIKFSSFTNMYE